MRFIPTSAVLLGTLGFAAAAGSAAAQNHPMPAAAPVASASNFNEIDPSQLALSQGQSQAVRPAVVQHLERIKAIHDQMAMAAR